MDMSIIAIVSVVVIECNSQNSMNGNCPNDNRMQNDIRSTSTRISDRSRNSNGNRNSSGSSNNDKRMNGHDRAVEIPGAHAKVE